VDCGLSWVFYEKYFGFTGLIRPILSVSPASLYGIIFILFYFSKIYSYRHFKRWSKSLIKTITFMYEFVW
jgi:hypothetical protein